jgi:hypothetical protein
MQESEIGKGVFQRLRPMKAKHDDLKFDLLGDSIFFNGNI